MALPTLSDDMRLIAAALLAIVSIVGCSPQPSAAAAGSGPTHFGEINEARLLAADQEPDQWMAPGRDYRGAYYSPLAGVNQSNVARLGFAWDYKLGTRRGLEATPIVVDGVLFTSGNWGWVYALDAATGRELWTYDPGVDGQWGRYAPSDVVNRGVVVSGGKVYVGSLDGYLHAIDAKTGKRVWKVDTLPSRGRKDFRYTITGAPLIAGDAIVIGHGGGDFKGGRGTVSAYDLRTGAFRWRFFVVPRDPHQGPQEQPHLEAALETYPANYDWQGGGGGAVWDGLSYDPELKLVYAASGNAAPYQVMNTGQVAHDELYAASIIAIHADTGQMAWHYQVVPGDAWDFDAAQKMILADIDIAGRTRKVLMQASKSGFFYALDRASGEFISAAPFAYVNWTQGLDPATHRPIPANAADWTREPKLVFPGAQGAHNWQPMSYSPKTGLVYIPAIEGPMVFVNAADKPAGLMEFNFELAFIYPEDYDPGALAGLFGKLPPLDTLTRGIPAPAKSQGLLRAYDPVRQKVVWEATGSSIWDGGVLSTAGDLVFRGDAAGMLNVYSAGAGRLLKQIDVGTAMMAAPMSYRVHGEQYVAVMAGYGGGLLFDPYPPGSAPLKYGNDGRIVAFKLGGGAVPKPRLLGELPPVELPPHEGTEAQIAAGEVLYNRYCARCHVMGVGLLPDLRRMSPGTHSVFYEIVLNGAYQAKGMARWDDVLSRSDAEAIHAYLVGQTWQAFAPPERR